MSNEVSRAPASHVSAADPMGECELPQDITAEVEIGGEEVVRTLSSRWRELCDEVGGAPFNDRNGSRPMFGPLSHKANSF